MKLRNKYVNYFLYPDIFIDITFVIFYSQNTRGVVAQLGERLNGIQEVRGSIPLSSTSLYKGSKTGPFFILNYR